MRYWQPRTVPGNPRITMIVACYLAEDRRRLASLRCLLASFESQTYPHWQAVVVHDGPILPELAAAVDQLRSDRVTIEQTEQRCGHFGHKHRHGVASRFTDGWIGFTNDDNYYMPVYFEWMLSEGEKQRADMVYCDMVHSHQKWQPFVTQPRSRRLDMGGFVARASLVKKTPWTDFGFRGDGIFINGLARNSRKTIKVAATLFVHN